MSNDLKKITETVSTSNILNPIFFGFLTAFLGTILHIAFSNAWLIPFTTLATLLVLIFTTKNSIKIKNILVFISWTILMFWINY